MHIPLEEYWNANIDFQESLYKQAHLERGALILYVCSS
jgi:hypothetical protein